jgi:two-component system cell cycle sensor histidine kinase/response regulator CckA
MDSVTHPAGAVDGDALAAVRRHVCNSAGEIGDIEHAFLQMQRLATVGRLAAEVAQDFGNLMTVILGYSELIIASAEQGRPPDPEQLAELRRAAGRASELTSRLLGHSRRPADDPLPLDMSLLVKGVAPLLSRIVGSAAHLVVRADPNAGAVLADTASVEQMLINLVLNARDASTAGGSFDVTVDPVRLTAALPHRLGTVPSGDYVRLRVRDRGRGMTPENDARLFRPFFTTKPFGAGLGMSVVAQGARKTSAAVIVETTAGAGTTVDVLFPRLDEKAVPGA